MRSKFDAQLKELGEKLTLMGAMCEEAIANSAKALGRLGACKKARAA